MPQHTDVLPEINEKMSPMIRQYLEIKQQYADSIVLFRLGDFYEMFFTDATLVASLLDLTLTARPSGENERAPMCGVPYHSCESYISRLVKKGYRVAVCEQIEQPGDKKIIERRVTRVITPGTVTEDSMLETSRNNYLATVYRKDNTVSCCFVDISTGEFNLTTFTSDAIGNDIVNELTRFSPKELLINAQAYDDKTVNSFLRHSLECRTEIFLDDEFSNEELERDTLNHFRVNDFDSINVDEIAKNAVSRTIAFLYKTQKNDLANIRDINIYSNAQFMQLDMAARTNLELTETIRGGNKKATLLWVLNQCKTPMGKRLINHWLEFPLISIAAISRRQNAVGELTNDVILLDQLSDILSYIKDLERLTTRVVYKTINPKELVALRNTLEKMPTLKATIADCRCEMLREIYNGIDELQDVYKLLLDALEDDPPVTLRDGKLIKRGFDEEIDRNFYDMTDGKDIVRQLEERERERTGVKKLKVKYNRVFGYYIEIPAAVKDFVPPEDYVRRQTVASGERYTTEEVRQLEGRILGAQDRWYTLEYEMYCKIRDAVGMQSERIRKTAVAIAKLDAIYSLATIAYENSYTCPELNATGEIEIVDGRHPVVEKLGDISFVPNDTSLDLKDNRCAIITGPNMAGKSTYMRQVAIITLMAHIGSFVPAKSAKISITDAIFTRVGASDDLAHGQSTFMVEMKEIAGILKNATSKSLLIIDEVGRGTSTYDGMAIARAVLEFVADKKKLGAKTLFATHYHELSVLETTVKGVKNYNIAAKKDGDTVVFLRKIIRGSADESYGIEVAKLAGLPADVIKNAKKILKSIESASKADFQNLASVEIPEEEDTQITFSDTATDSIIKDLKTVDINNLTPFEALTLMNELVEKAKNI